MVTKKILLIGHTGRSHGKTALMLEYLQAQYPDVEIVTKTLEEISSETAERAAPTISIIDDPIIREREPEPILPPFFLPRKHTRPISPRQRGGR